MDLNDPACASPSDERGAIRISLLSEAIAILLQLFGNSDDVMHC